MSEERKPHINTAAARSSEQSEQYATIADSGVCPFCPEHYGTFEHQTEPVRSSEHWYAIDNMVPYKFTKLHRVIITKRHVEFPEELSDEEWVDLLRSHIKKERVERALGYGAIGMRFGDPVETGASVAHLHAHLIVPDPDQVSVTNTVKFRMSRKFHSEYGMPAIDVDAIGTLSDFPSDHIKPE